MKKFKVRLGNFNIPVYVEHPTNRMMIRVITKDNHDNFVDGIDYIRGIWLSTLNIFGWTLQELIEVHFDIYYKRSYYNIKYIYVCDDESNGVNTSLPEDARIVYTRKIKDVDLIEE